MNTNGSIFLLKFFLFNCLKAPWPGPGCYNQKYPPDGTLLPLPVLPSVARGVARAVVPFGRGGKRGAGVPQAFPLTPIRSRTVGVPLVPKDCNLELLRSRAHPFGPPGFCWRGGLPLGGAVRLSPQIHPHSPVSQKLGFTRTPSFRTAQLKDLY